MEKKKILALVITVIIITLLYFSGLYALIVYFLLSITGLEYDGYLDLIEESNYSKINQSNVINISEKDFKKCPKLKELFTKINPERESKVSTVKVKQNVIDTIWSDYPPDKYLYWNNSYYHIFPVYA
ncbi:hypothetical protein [Methanoplanus limicola]|uniref:Uncharacterized protein n=1 Tax=Methanoplanus limicola DSM 2279 TaxID=937775 RepID=H1YZZ6_9EURY|nr:hypothetical protein [Methanoplanus limicola]EHQ35203.1 hypothetical protein Metlim_1089 [Methanoplanus limicola DSM 2279]